MMLEAESDRLRLPKVKLPDWIRNYAARAWQDRIYLERTVSPLQVTWTGSTCLRHLFLVKRTAGVTRQAVAVIAPSHSFF